MPRAGRYSVCTPVTHAHLIRTPCLQVVFRLLCIGSRFTPYPYSDLYFGCMCGLHNIHFEFTRMLFHSPNNLRALVKYTHPCAHIFYTIAISTNIPCSFHWYQVIITLALCAHCMGTPQISVFCAYTLHTMCLSKIFHAHSQYCVLPALTKLPHAVSIHCSQYLQYALDFGTQVILLPFRGAFQLSASYYSKFTSMCSGLLFNF